MSGSIPPLPQYAFMAYCSAEAQAQRKVMTQVKMTSYFEALEH